MRPPQPASPCHAKWAEMTGDERIRVCGRCKRNVYEASALTTDETRALIDEHEATTSVRYWKRSDGTLLTRDCPVGRRWKRLRRAAAVLGLIVLAMVPAAAVKLRLRLEWIGNRLYLYQGVPEGMQCPGLDDMVRASHSPPPTPSRPPGRPPLPPLPEFR